MFISNCGTATNIVDDGSNSPDVSLSYMYNNYLRRDHSNALPGPLDMKGNRIKHIPMNPEDTSDAVSADFVNKENIKLKEKAMLRNGLQSMTGHLDMDSHYINNVLDPVNNQDVATKLYVDTINRKSIITIWAVKKKSLTPSRFEWSFGHTLVEDCHGHQGYTMIKNGRLLGLGLSTNNDQSDNLRFQRSIAVENPGPDYCSAFGGEEMKVNMIVNGTENTVYSITKPVSHWSNTICFSIPFTLNAGDWINFVSHVTYSEIKTATVSALIELDL